MHEIEKENVEARDAQTKQTEQQIQELRKYVRVRGFSCG
jgi:hypothetical protein